MWKHANARERAWIHFYNPGYQVVANLSPFDGDGLIANMRCHCTRPRRKDRHVRTSFFKKTQLVGLNRLAYYVIWNIGVRRTFLPNLKRSYLRMPPLIVRFWQNSIVPMTVDNHRHDCSPFNAAFL